jgi:hypothetical protein
VRPFNTLKDSAGVQFMSNLGEEAARLAILGEYACGGTGCALMAIRTGIRVPATRRS